MKILLIKVGPVRADKSQPVVQKVLTGNISTDRVSLTEDGRQEVTQIEDV